MLGCMKKTWQQGNTILKIERSSLLELPHHNLTNPLFRCADENGGLKYSLHLPAFVVKSWQHDVQWLMLYGNGLEDWPKIMPLLHQVPRMNIDRSHSELPDLLTPGGSQNM